MTPDLSPLTSNPSPITSCIIQLQKSYRFTEDSGIRRISRAVNTGNADAELIHLKEGKYKDIFWKDLPHPDALGTSIRDAIINGFKDYLNSVKSLCEFQISNFKFQLTEIFKKFDQFRILCALRQGHYGVEMVNRLAEQIFRKEKLIASDKIWYPGRPVMITSNDYNLHLFNGDIGITLPDPEANNEIRVFFPASNGSSDMCNPFRKFNPHRLPYHETVYAMTVHKSQGSEFEKVLLLLPNKDYPLLTRELIYTGITRAIKNVEIWGNEAIFCAAVSRRIERTSGLEDALWEY